MWTVENVEVSRRGGLQQGRVACTDFWTPILVTDTPRSARAPLMFSPRLSGGGTPLIRTIKKELSSSGALLILYPVFALRFSFILASPAFCKIFSQNDKVKLHTVKPIVHPYSRKVR